MSMIQKLCRWFVRPRVTLQVSIDPRQGVTLTCGRRTLKLVPTTEQRAYCHYFFTQDPFTEAVVRRLRIFSPQYRPDDDCQYVLRLWVVTESHGTLEYQIPFEEMTLHERNHWNVYVDRKTTYWRFWPWIEFPDGPELTPIRRFHPKPKLKLVGRTPL